MKHIGILLANIALIYLLAHCSSQPQTEESSGNTASVEETEVRTEVQQVALPQPFETKSVKNFSKVIGWTGEQKPTAPAGFAVTRFAADFVNPRWIYQAPNGDIFVAESNTESTGTKKITDAVSGRAKSQRLEESANRITLLRDTNKDGVPDLRHIYLTGLNKPFGMLVLGNYFYVANTDGLWRYPYKAGETELKSQGEKIAELPAGGYNNHWTRNIIANADGSKIYVSVGSGSNVAEHGMENEIRRANILEMNPDGTSERIYASGLRNPVGMDWAPGTQILWTAVNERDELGDELVPDYMTSVKQGGFYGWPYAYFGPNPDPRMEKEQKPELVQKTLVPDVPLGSHTASLGLAFYDQKDFPQKYRNGAFIGQHGSWNRANLSGYKVVFVPFENGKPAGKPEDFLTGFVANAEKSEVYGRPVGVTVLQDGSLLVADDAANTIWRVSTQK